MKHTTNYNLNKIELTDSPPDITALNPNFDTIDAQLKSLADKDAEIVASINTVKNNYLPKTGGNITNALKVKNKTVAVSVNGSTADANGNITIDVGGKVQSVNGVQPDENGNVVLDLGGDVQSVDGVEPDTNGNVTLNASTREEILEGAMRVTDVEVDASVATHEALQTAVAQVEANLDSKLSLSGGTMTGDVALANGKNFKNTVDTGWTRFYGGTSMDTGARIQIAGKSCSGFEGQVWAVANDGTNSCSLKLYPDGTATWGNKNVVCVESWSSGSNWYRVWSDGMIEQGGMTSAMNFYSSPRTITFHKAYSSGCWYVGTQVIAPTTGEGVMYSHTTAYNYSKTSFTASNVHDNASVRINWYSIGK